MDDRLVLHTKLETLFPELKLYFRPPSKFLLEYPCIVYDVKRLIPIHANNGPYVVGTIFNVKMLSKLPGFAETKRIYDLGAVSHVTSYTLTDIVHDIFEISVHTA